MELILADKGIIANQACQVRQSFPANENLLNPTQEQLLLAESCKKSSSTYMNGLKYYINYEFQDGSKLSIQLAMESVKVVA